MHSESRIASVVPRGRRRWPAVLACALLVCTSSGCARSVDASPWPASTITIIVPFRAGGGFDLQARLLANAMKKYLPHPVEVVVKNVEGAGARLGAAELARSRPDGYTIGLVGLESVAFMRTLDQLPEDPREWTWLAQLGADALMVAAPATSGIDSAADLKDRDLRFGLSSETLASVALLSQDLGARIRPIHFDGSGEMVLAGMRGDVDVLIISWPAAIKGVRESDGKLVSLFVVSEQRVPSLPDVPTLSEFGVQPDPGIYAVGAITRVIAAPRGLDPAVQEVLTAAVTKALNDPEFIRLNLNGGFEVVPASAAEVRAKLAAAMEEFQAAPAIIAATMK
jgi:tripartite-type tricarboxylate transporter receptor subunit TctC